jgi:asparagine synthase (glutamine-hydrolysing)
VKVALSGDGGDEVFGGYGWHETVLRYEGARRRLRAIAPLLDAAGRSGIASLSETLPGLRVSGAARLFGAEFADRYFPVRGFFGGPEQRRLLGRAPADPAWLFRRFDRPDLPLPQRLMFLDLHTYLPDNGLTLVDRSTMAFGLEARVPLLDHRLVEHAFSLPPERLVRPGATKIAFREAVQPWIPAAVLRRPKKGFSPPFKRWVGGAGRDAALDKLARGALAADGVLDARQARRIVESGAQRRHGKLWLLLNLEAWYRRWIRGPGSKAGDPPGGRKEQLH